MYLSIYVCMYVSIYLSIYVSIYICIYLSICLSVRPSIHPPTHSELRFVWERTDLFCGRQHSFSFLADDDGSSPEIMQY